MERLRVAGLCTPCHARHTRGSSECHGNSRCYLFFQRGASRDSLIGPATFNNRINTFTQRGRPLVVDPQGVEPCLRVCKTSVQPLTLRAQVDGHGVQHGHSIQIGSMMITVSLRPVRSMMCAHHERESAHGGRFPTSNPRRIPHFYRTTVALHELAWMVGKTGLEPAASRSQSARSAC